MSKIVSVSTLDKLAKGIDARFAEVFVENVDNYKSNISQLFMLRDSEKTREHTKLVGGTGELPLKEEGDTTQRVDPAYSYETEYIHDEFEKGVTLTRRAVEDKDYADKIDEFAMLTRSGLVSQDKAMSQVFNGGFATTTLVNGYKLSMLGDDVPLFSTIHPLQTGATISNASSNGAPLTGSALEDGIVNIMHQKMDDGVALELNGKLALVVPPNLRKKALELTGSELEAESANNAVNIYRGNIDVFVVSWLANTHGGSDTAWYLSAQGQARLMRFLRRGLTPDFSVDNNTKNRNYDLSARWSVGHSDWRATYASKGDGAAYSS